MSTLQSSAVASAALANPESSFGVSDLIALVRKRGGMVLKIATAFVVLTAVMLLVWPSSYSSTAVVMLDPRKNNITDRSQVLTGLPTDPASVQDQIQILTSHDLAALVIDRLHLANDPEFNRSRTPFPLNLFTGGLSAEARRSAMVEVFLKHLAVEAQGLSTAVSVTFSADQSDKAARIANAVTQAYIDSQIAQKSEAGQRTTAWLRTRIAALARQVQADEAAVQSYKAANGLNDSGQGTQSLVDQQLAAVNSQLIQARADLAEKQATYSHVAAMVKSGRAADVSQVVSSPLIAQLRQQQADAIRNLAELDSHYGPKHPKRIAAESQLRDLDSKVEQEAERIAGSVANDAAVASAQVRSLESSLARIRAESNVQNLARVKLRALEAGAASTRSMYETFLTRLRETQDQDAVTIPDARVISHASIPARPSSPPRLLVFCASLPAGFLLGLLCALVMERAGPLWRAETASAPRLLRPPVVAVVPDAHGLAAAEQVIAMPSSPFSRALFGLGERLASFSPVCRPRTILVSGFDPEDAIASVAVGLARALALLGHNVMLVDADLGRCAAARMAGSMDSPNGMHEVLRGAVPLSRAVAKDRSSPVLVLANAPPEGIAKSHWEAGATTALFQHLRRVCDFVIIHAPAQSDMLALVSMADGILFVGAAGHAESLATKAATFARGARHLGLVLTA